ncbi:fam-m protein [Plasmodium malariae]|uniref:Fam-m protein n=1 Tax=Plasmodium malariae TaxID=5858 RepID=A0A1D3JHF3_PLAMA|nr:fam-m protein [Plasmodium malariae]SBT85602.1 fam-m protein [Plasmodium malariae]
MTLIMERKIKLILFIKIALFVLLKWICYFNIEASMFKKSFNRYFDLDRKTNTKNYRLLAKSKRLNNSNNLEIIYDISNNAGYKKISVNNNERGDKEKKKQSNRCLLNKAQYYTEYIDYNNGIFDGKHFHFEKKWIKKKNYDNFLEKKRRIRAITLKKIKLKKYGFGVALFFIFFLMGIGLPIKRGFELSVDDLDSKRYAIEKAIIDFVKELTSLEEGQIYIILFAVVFIILAIILIIAIYKIIRNNEKYNKIKLMTEQN